MSLPRRTAEELLARSHWLRRLARSLLDDPHAAEDAVQEVMVAAVGQPPGRVANWGAWMARVLRRTVARNAASDRQRRRREIAVGHERTAEPAAEIVAQAALQREVVGYVLELEEPYRTTLLLRFWEDLRPRQVAERMGVPIDTVYARISRGLAKLRRRLQAERRDWRSAIAPFAGAPFAGAPFASVSFPCWTGLVGVASMSMQTKIILGAACAALALLLWARPFTDAPAPVAPDRGASVPAEIVADGRAQDANEPASDTGAPRRVAAASNDVAFSVNGSVRSYAGQPIGGVRIAAKLFVGFESRGTPALVATLSADSAGHFTWTPELPRHSVTLQFTSADPEQWHGYGTTLVLRGAAGVHEVEVRGELLDLRVTGSVLDERDQPVASARVWCPYTGIERVTGADGRFALPASAASSNLLLYCRCDGFVLAHAEVATKTDDNTLSYVFRLRASITYRGRVVDAAGLPVEGARMRTGHAFGQLGSTGADGRFVLASMDPASNEQTVWFTHADFKPRRVVMRPADAARELTVTLHRGVRVEGRVTSPDGHGVPGVEVRVRPEDSGGASDVSNDDGIFVVQNAESGAQLLEAEHRGYVAFKRTIDVPATGAPLTGVEVRLEPERSLSGRIVDDAGNAITEAGVAGRRDGRYYHRGGRADESGRFRLDGLPPGRMDLEVYGSGYLRRVLRDVMIPQVDYEIVLQRAASLAGRVLDAATGEPITRFKVRFVRSVREPGDTGIGMYDARWAEPGYGFRSEDGTWSTNVIGGGEFRPGGRTGIEITAEGYAPHIEPRVVATIDATPDAFLCRLHRPGTITGRVVARDSGAPVAGATVRLTSETRPLRSVDGWPASNAITTRTDGSGGFVLRGVPIGEASLRVEHVRHAWQLDGPFEVASGETEERLVQLERGARVSGMAPPATSVGLRALDAPGVPDLLLMTESGDNGEFAFAQPLPPGRYAVFAWQPRAGDALQWLQAEVPLAGEPARVELATGGATLLRAVFAGSAARSSGARIRPAGPGPWIEVPRSGDALEIHGLPAGAWEVHRVGVVHAK